MKTKCGAQHINIFKVVFLLIIASSLVCYIFISSQKKLSYTSRKHPIYVLEKENSTNTTEYKARRLPQAIIIGAKKCGTRALLNFINIHPKVRICNKEIHFFVHTNTYARGYEWYRKQMPISFPDQITMEKSPPYFVSDASPVRIREMNPLTKIVLILRDPVVRAISDYVHIKSLHEPNLPPFEEMAFLKDTDKVNESWRPIYVGKYAHYLRRWLENFPREQILILSGEKLIADPFAEVQKLETFLGLEPAITQDHFVFNKTKGFMCFKSFDKRKTECLHKSKGTVHPEVDPAALQKLSDFYKPYNQELYEMAGTNFEW